MSFWIVMAVCMGCNPTEPASPDSIAELESKAFVGDTIKHHIRQKLMVQYAEFALTHPHAEFAPEALMRRADLLISAGKFEHAVLPSGFAAAIRTMRKGRFPLFWWPLFTTHICMIWIWQSGLMNG